MPRINLLLRNTEALRPEGPTREGAARTALRRPGCPIPHRVDGE